MAVKNENKYLSDAVFWELEATSSRFCRDDVTILGGAGADRVLTKCMVVAKVSKGAAAATAKAGNTGNGTVGAITVGAAAKPGKHKVTFVEPATNLGAFTVTDPDGVELKPGTVASAYSDGGLGFTIADGAADFVSGDQFDIDVAAGSGKVVQIDFAGTNGSEDAIGLLIDDFTAPNGVDAPGVIIARGPCVLKKNGLVWPAGASTPQKDGAIAQLAALGFIVRTDA